MCLESNLQIYLFIGFVLLGIIYLTILKLKHIRKKKFNIRLLFTIIILLIIYILLFGMIKKCDDKKNEYKKPSTTTLTTTTSTTTSSNTTTTTTTSNQTTKTTKKSDNTSSNGKYVGTSSKGYQITYKDGAYYVDGYLIVNKTYDLPSTWKPKNVWKSVPSSGFAKEPLDKDAYNAWKDMLSDSKAVGLNLWAQSGYRSYDYQKDLYNSYVKRKGKAAADKSSARPGNSEHQTGLAFDLNTITTAFKDTAEGKWVKNNCYLYGYILRYPENSTDKTGYIFEPWHIRYVGKDLAKKLYNNGNWITMEEYFGLKSEYPN
ncbi:M15 family metallopeptidase [bacterium]|nr:M15 family metallopeptidase [bacterium]